MTSAAFERDKLTWTLRQQEKKCRKFNVFKCRTPSEFSPGIGLALLSFWVNSISFHLSSIQSCWVLTHLTRRFIMEWNFIRRPCTHEKQDGGDSKEFCFYLFVSCLIPFRWKQKMASLLPPPRWLQAWMLAWTLCVGPCLVGRVKGQII